MTTIDLEGQVALVTGGSRGLGRAAVLALAGAGADVAVQYVRDEAAAGRVVEECRVQGRRALALRADVASADDVAGMFGRLAAELGRLDVLVASAGIWKEAPIDAMTDKQLAETLDVNVKGVFACCRAAVRLMKQQGSGRIILVSSTAGQRGEAFHSHYAATKGAVQALTKSWAPEFAPFGILVNCVAPGWVDTDMCTEVFRNADFRKQVEESIPLTRIPPPEDIAGPILFLASDLARHITGTIIHVNGGAVLCG